jgi:transposase-like protein
MKGGGVMDNKLKTLLDLAKALPENSLDAAISKLAEIKEESEKTKPDSTPKSPKCGGTHIVRNGHQSGKQQYLCRECGGSFVETTDSVVSGSHSGKTVWKQVISDTINGIAIDKTAESLDLHHETVFNMRHKILYCLERVAETTPKTLEGVCEADETYILESVKGKKIPDDYHRKPRKHGAVSSKRGISDEYICICAAVERDGMAFSTVVNRAAPSKAELLEVFGERVKNDTLLLCDGAKNYEVLSENDKCVTATAKPGLNNINTVNGYHSLIKERNRAARGFATKYLNRYNSLFEIVFRMSDSIVDNIFELVHKISGGFSSVNVTQNSNLLAL